MKPRSIGTSSCEYDGSKGLNQRVEQLPSVLYLEHARTFLALADALDLDQVHWIAVHLQQFPKHRLVEETVHQGPNVASVLG